MKKIKKRDKIVIPVFETDPIAKAEEGNEKTMNDAIEMAKKWVEDNKL